MAAATPTHRTGVDRAVRAAAAAELEDRLRRKPTRAQRLELAHSRWLGPALAARLARSADPYIRGTVAGNPATPAALVACLAGDNKLSVRLAAYEHPACPFDLIDPDDDRYAPMRHPSCPPDRVVAALEDRHLRDLALQHPNLPSDVRRRVLDLRVHHDLGRLLESPGTTHLEAMTILDVLSDGDSQHRSMYRWIWAAHPNADGAWLAQLGEDSFGHSDQGTVARVAKHPNTPGPMLARIVAEHAHRDYALENPSCPPEALLREARRTPESNPGVTPFGFRSRTQQIAANPNADQAVLAELTIAAVSGTHLYSFLLAHAETASQVRTVLALAPTWTGNLADLLATAAAVTDDPHHCPATATDTAPLT